MIASRHNFSFAKYLCVIMLFCLVSYAQAADQSLDTYPFTSITDTQRFQSLTNEIRCVVCQGESIAESSAPLATDLRTKVYRMILEKKSNEEIKDYMVQRYGEFILLQPRFNKSTAVLWLFPFLAIACMALLLMRFVVKIKQSA